MSSPSPIPDAGARRLSIWVLLSALMITGVVTYAVWHFTFSRDEAEARVGFEARANQIDITLRERMRDYEQALLGMSTVFNSGAPLDRARWIAQFEFLRVTENYPGFQGIGYAPWVTSAEKPQHEAALRKQENPDYTIRPEGARTAYTPVIYLAPANERHRRAIGFDMYHETLRRNAMDTSRDKGQAVITRKVLLSQEQKEGMQPGFLMYMPVYRRDTGIATSAQRLDAIQGYVFSTFRSYDLINSLLPAKRDIRVELFDGTEQSAGSLMYDSAQMGNTAAGAPAAPRFSMLAAIPIYGASWTLRVSSLPEFEAAIGSNSARVAAGSATLICLLALTMIWSQLTLRRRAEGIAQQITRDLAQSREQLQLALEGSDLALFDWNMSTGEVQLSARWSVMLGGAPEPVHTTLKALEALVPPEDQVNVATQIREVLAGRTERYQVEHRVRRHDGTYIWVASHAKVGERDSMNRPLRMVGTNVDISQRKEMERMKNEFVSTVSHELRTPITALIGALGLLRAGTAGPLPDKASTFLDMAYQNGERLSVLVNDILTLENAQAGHTAFALTPVNLASFLERAISMNAGLMQKKNVRIVLDPVAPSLCVHADSDRLLQVVTNLLSNAVKFSPDSEQITLAAKAHGTVARVSVIDNGVGIAPEFKGRVFERFAQADGSSTRAQGGTGLGLAVCKTLIEAMGGQIGYTSEPGKGSTFYFDLPIGIQAPAVAAGASAGH